MLIKLTLGVATMMGLLCEHIYLANKKKFVGLMTVLLWK